jgi:hypothetical protein
VTRGVWLAPAAAVAVAMSALAGLAASACTLTVPGADAGSDASSSGPQTVLEQCTAIYTEWCQQAIGRCDFMGYTSLNDCITSSVDTCCSAGVCNETALSSAAAVDACKAALDAEDCYSLTTVGAPSACQGLPQKP